MNYYINSGAGKRKTTGKAVLYALGFVAVFLLSFFVSFKLISGTGTDTAQVQSLKEEVTSLTVQLAEKEERILSLELQIQNIQAMISEQAQQLAEARAQLEAGAATDEPVQEQ